MKETYKNDVISSDPYTDLAGNTQYRAGYGTRRLYIDFESRAYEADENEVLSSDIVCDICGVPVKKNKNELVKQNGFYRCKMCIDEAF